MLFGIDWNSQLTKISEYLNAQDSSLPDHFRKACALYTEQNWVEIIDLFKTEE